MRDNLLRASRPTIVWATALVALSLGTACHRGDVAESAGASAPDNGPTAPPITTAVQIGTTMTLWRQAILERNADNVMICNEQFLDHPDIYRDALLTSAESDPDERVRAFSTRVLGKYQDTRLGPRFVALLGAESPLVRQNAAWAMAAMPPGMARPALERALHDDPSPDVRKNADEAIRRLGHPPRLMR